MITLLGLVCLYLIYKFFSFIRFYYIARRTGYPIFVTPAFSQTLPWLILAPAFAPLAQKYLPEWLFERVDVATYGWDFRFKNRLHQRLGKTFVVVSPDECSLWIADPALASSVLARREDFNQPAIVAQILGFFGDHIFAANGESWQRQRKIIAPHLNETVMETVWNETRRQADSMSQYLTKNPESETLNALRSIAINVLGHAGYGQNQPWTPDYGQALASVDSDWPSGRRGYFKTIAMVIDNFQQAALLPAFIKKLPFMPSYLRRLGKQMDLVPGYIDEIIAEAGAKKSETTLEEKKPNFLDMLVQFTQSHGQSENQSTKGLYLSKGEISGNLWIFTGAGFETTANTMGYATLLLAAYPEWQEWIREDLKGLKSWEYKSVFPQSHRILALMWETLRMFTPVAHVSRCVDSAQYIADEQGDHLLPPSMNVYIASQSMHMNESIWGPDVNEFNPARWIDSASNQVVTPVKGSFLPWSGGPRVCPGMKMSQVEFVAAIATLFSTMRCEPLNSGSTPAERQKILKDTLDDSAPKLTLQVRDPKQIVLRWTEVSSD